MARGVWAGSSFASTFADGLDAAFGCMSAFLTLALVAADEDSGLDHLDVVPEDVRLHPLSVHTTYAFYVGGVLRAEAKALVAHWEREVASLEGGGSGGAQDTAPPGAALLQAVRSVGGGRLNAAIAELPASAARRLPAHCVSATCAPPPTPSTIERHPAEFAFSSLSAARCVPTALEPNPAASSPPSLPNALLKSL